MSAFGEVPDGGTDETVVLERGGLATSTTVRRHWSRGGEQIHHLLDPSTGRPVTSTWRTASVAATTCVAANTASTAAIVLGSDAQRWLNDRGLAARLIDQDGHALYVGGWPEEDGTE